MNQGIGYNNPENERKTMTEGLRAALARLVPVDFQWAFGCDADECYVTYWLRGYEGTAQEVRAEGFTELVAALRRVEWVAQHVVALESEGAL
jgi:hypothetical protein